MELSEMKHDQSLTLLERELIEYVERLAIAFETSSDQFKTLEARSAKMIYAKQERIETSLALLIESQASLVAGLSSFARYTDKNTKLPTEFEESRKAVQAALEIMKDEMQADY